jgi:transposase-like protein
MVIGEVIMSSKRYTEEFRIEAIRQVVDRGYSIAEVADRLGTTTHSLYVWKKKYGPDSAEHQVKTESNEELGGVAGGISTTRPSSVKGTAPTTQINDMDSEMGFEDSGTLHIANQFTTLPIKDLF